MPQLKLPDSLYSAGLSVTRVWLVNAANTIYLRYGNYDSIECLQAVAQLNQFLTSSVPCHIIDDLYNCAEILLDPESRSQCKNLCLQRQIKFDQRIVLSMCIHKNMKTLTAHKFVNDAFWKSTLVSLQNLLRLDLNKVCTDEILEVVGKNCVNLEFIDIVSKSCHTRTRDRHNALKLHLCVSDVGLRFLSNCKQLKEIQMTCIIRKGCGGRQITNEGIKQLLLSLPKLRRINYTDTGTLFNSINLESEKLSLISIIDWHPCATRIPIFESLCPSLTELHLTHGFSTDQDECRRNMISALSHSGLRISVLSLTNFPFDGFLKSYLELKGCYLVVFNFVSSYIESVYELFLLLGRVCKNLEHLYMHFQFLGRSNSVTQSSSRESACSDEAPFSNLRSLTIKSHNILESHYSILPVLLKNASFIKKIVLSSQSYPRCLDDSLEHIMRTNPFLHLETVSFYKGAIVSFQFLKYFIFTCPVIKNVSIDCESQAYAELVEQLYEELLLKNYDVNIKMYRPNT